MEVNWVDNIPAELVQAVITALTTICNKIWQPGGWPSPSTQSLVITLPKKGNLPELPDDQSDQPPKQSRKRRRSLQKNRQEGASQSRSFGKTKWITNNTSGIDKEIKVNGQKLEIVTSFGYLELVAYVEGSKPEILSRIAQTTAALTRLKTVWNDRRIKFSLSSKIRLMRSLLTSIFPYAC